ncbi:EamA family transporter [Microbacterium sp. Gd 4-13]|uniref:DMT family transporter n=1 Tax=Microbacterium sp. Gd 4-13 TaxID=2173179 RepID=UPI000D56DC88|nr:DMT family transporter [Microbacterium sp. Gd 4-13]PVW04436.1 EamA family transporter [Microbacterium sp. Gd 4-13]
MSSPRPASSATLARGLGWGMLGVTAFSFTVPLTHIAVEALPPVFVGAGRAVVAAVLAVIALVVTRQRRPSARQGARLAVVAAGVVVGFPMLTSLALTSASASHGAVVIAVLPAATAVAAVVRGRERPSRSFWIAAALGAVAAIAFAALNGGAFAPLQGSDLLLLAAVVAAAIGYAEGGMLARELGSWQTVSWALVLASPLMIVLTAGSAWAAAPVSAPPEAWLSLAYLSVVSMFLGFFAWYRGLAIGPMAQVSQVQLVQPVLTLAWAALILHEHITALTVIGGLAVIACAGIAVRTRARPSGGRRDERRPAAG